jgi:hypothetical protein
LREERTLRMFQNRVLKGILGLKRDEVAEEWSEL